MSTSSFNNKVSPKSGLNCDDIVNIKVFMRSYNDALRCSQEIAQKDTSVDHYKDYMKVLIRAAKTKNVSTPLIIRSFYLISKF